MRSLRTAGSRLAGSCQLASQNFGRSTQILYLKWASTSASSSKGSSSGRAPAAAAFFHSDEPLLRSLERKQLRYRLVTAGEPSADRQAAQEIARAEIRWLVEEVRASQQGGGGETPLSREQRRRLIRMARDMTRACRPISYVLGHQPFSDLPRDLIVRAPCLIPRPETDEWATQIAEAVASHLEQSVPSGSGAQPFRILDLCTGSGCIAVLMAHTLKERLGPSGWHIVACDRSPEAIDLARENARQLGVPLANLSIHQGDLFSPADMKRLLSLCEQAPEKPFDLVVCNPPYIPRSEWEKLDPSVREWEDPLALIGERAPSLGKGKAKELEIHDGLDFFRQLEILLRDPSLVRPANRADRLPRLVAEFGQGQAEAVKTTFAASPSSLPAVRRTIPTPRKIVRLQRKLMVAGLGNYTHPLTRHSIGQLLLENLPARILHRELHLYDQLKKEAERMDKHRRNLIGGDKLDGLSVEQRAKLDTPIVGPVVQALLPITADTPKGLTRPAPANALSANRDVRGWDTTVPILIDPNPPKGHQKIKGQPSLPLVQLDLVLYKPRYLMNENGKGISKALVHHRIPTTGVAHGRPDRYADVLVLHDELSRAFGKVSRKDRGSAAGHNGVRSCFSSLQIRDVENETLSRLRIGIGRAEDSKPKAGDGWIQGLGKRVDTASWVLGKMEVEQVESCGWVGPEGEDDAWRGDESRPLPKGLDPLQPGAVFELAFREVIQWARERAVAALEEEGWEPDGSEAMGPNLGQRGVARLEIKRDLFGVERTVWLY